jgi:hypothetical protein
MVLRRSFTVCAQLRFSLTGDGHIGPPNHRSEDTTNMFGIFFRVIAALALLGLIAVIGINVYDAGVSAGLAEAGRQAVASGAPAPAVYYPGPYYGHGWGPGFGFFGFLFLLFGIFLFFGLLRAVFGWGRWGGYRGGPGGWGRHDGPRGHFDEWHQRAHDAGDQPKQA